MKKRGLSEVVTTLILVLLVLVAIAIVWVVISNLIREKGDDIGASTFEVSMAVKTVTNSSTLGNVLVRVERNVGEGNLQGINIIMSDGINSETVRVDPIDEGEETTYDISKGGLGAITKVSIRPVGGSEGNEKVGEVVGERELSYEQSVKSLGGLVAWWKLDGDAKDSSESVPSHDGTNNGATFVDEGQVGKAANFDGLAQIITVPDHNDLELISSKTFALWFKAPIATPNEAIFGKDGLNQRAYFLRWDSTNSNRLRFLSMNPAGTLSGAITSTSNDFTNWHHIAIVFDTSTSTSKMYIDGNFDATGTYFLPSQVTSNLYIGGGYGGGQTFDSTIDELMIFNKALTADEVKSIYELTK